MIETLIAIVCIFAVFIIALVLYILLIDFALWIIEILFF